MNLSFGVKKCFFNDKIWQKYVKYDKIKTWHFLKCNFKHELISWVGYLLPLESRLLCLVSMMFQKCEKNW